MSILRMERWNSLLFPIVFLLAVGLRLAALDADPPSTVGLHFISDEGWWVHNARNKVLFDDWVTDEFNQSLLASPPFCIATYGAYSVFGVSYGTSRLVPVLSGLLSILLFAGILHIHSPPSTVLLATVLFGLNFGFTALNRTAYVDSTALLFLLAAWWLLERLQNRVWAVFLSGMCFALAILSKSYMVSILPPVLVILISRVLSSGKKQNVGLILLNICLFCGGVFGIYLLWRKYLYIPFSYDYRIMYSLWQDGNIPSDIHDFLKNLPSFIIGHHGLKLIPARFFGLNATLFILAGFRVYQLFLNTSGGFLKAWRNFPRIDRESILFLVLLSLLIAPMTAKPFRRYLLLYLPLVILASRSILPLKQQDQAGEQSSGLFKALALPIPGILAIILGSPFLIRLIPSHALSPRLAWLIVSTLAFVCITLAMLFVGKKQKFLRLPVFAAVLVFLIIDGGLHIHAAVTRSFTLRDTSRRLGREYFGQSSLVLGGIAGSLSLENQARTIAIWGREESPRVLNQNPVERFAPDYLIVLRKIDGMDWVRENRYERYVRKENYLETLHLLPAGNDFRIEAELYAAPDNESGGSGNPRIEI